MDFNPLDFGILFGAMSPNFTWGIPLASNPIITFESLKGFSNFREKVLKSGHAVFD